MDDVTLRKVKQMCLLKVEICVYIQLDELHFPSIDHPPSPGTWDWHTVWFSSYGQHALCSMVAGSSAGTWNEAEHAERRNPEIGQL